MENLFKYLIVTVILLLLLAVSSFTFEVVRIKITLFELLLPWVFLLWLYRNFKNKFDSLASLPLVILVPVALFFLSGIWLYFKNKFYPVYYEELLLNILFFAFLLSILETHPGSAKIHQIIFYSSIFIFGYGILQIFGIDPLLPGKEFLEKRRIYSTFANPNDLALFSNLVFFLGLYYLLEKRKPFIILFLSLALINLVYSKSGSGSLGFLAGWVVFVSRFKPRIRIITMILILVLILVLLFSLTYLKPDSFWYRVSIWKSAFQIIKGRPFFGWGLGSFQHLYPKFRNPQVYLLLKDHQIEFLHPENYYLDLMIEGGIFYLALFIFMNYLLLHFLAKERQNSICFYYFIILITLLFQNLFSETFYSFLPFFLYILITGLGLREIRKYPPGEKISLSFKFFKPISILFLFSSIIVTYSSIQIFKADLYLKNAIYNSQLRNFSSAETYYLKSIQFNYFNPLPHYLLANLYLERGREEDLYSALRFYNNVESLAGNYLQLYFLKGLVYYRLQDNEWAEYYLKKAFITDPYLYYRFKYYKQISN